MSSLVCKRVRPAPGGERAARDLGLGTGRGGDVTGAAKLLSGSRQDQRDVAVAGAGRVSPSAIQTFGSFCDCRFTKRYPVSDQSNTSSFWLSRMNSPSSV